jgi:hypothetical protein
MAVVRDRVDADYWEQRGLVLLWTAMLLPMAAWGIDQLTGYALVKPVCASGHKNILTLIGAGTLAMTIAGIWIGWSCLSQLGDGTEDGGRRIDRSYFMAMVAIGFNIIIALLIVTAAVPRFVLNPCE